MSLGRDFHLVQAAALLNGVGTRCSQLAVAWWALGVTGSTTLFATLIAVGAVADVAARGLLGWLGDRYPPRLLIAACYLVSAVCLVVLAWCRFAGLFSPVLIGGLLVVTGVCNGVREPLQATIIRGLVPVESVELAVRRRSSVMSASTLLAPVVASALIGTTGEKGTLAATAVAVVLSLVLVTVADAAPPQQAAQRRPGVFAGFRVVARLRVERHLAFSNFPITAAMYPVFAVLIPALTHRLHPGDVWLLGLLEAAFSAGLLAGSFGVVARIAAVLGKARTVHLGAALVGGSFAATGLVLLAAPGSVTLTAATSVLLACGGVGLTMYTINIGTTRVLASPAALRNRIGAAAAFAAGVAVPVGTFTSGLLVAWAGEELTLIGFGALIVVTAAALSRSRDLTTLLNLPSADLDNAYHRLYPDAFAKEQV
ncbi:MFS transporter [Lentzea sp. NBC_00516]|uniref:MFS transporter n=1 Tax=Lentzea sp. NBC_00516 TaxID=2903582 RepID=UPI002E7FEC7C|nr:MFS transporter [Lentzea sp. NBC_00516]WUD27444.1 MFS transporter [Lentzea sp. NBC_00516]